MKKEQDKKPDFLRDINTGIMEDLTAGGIKDNAAGAITPRSATSSCIIGFLTIARKSARMNTSTLPLSKSAASMKRLLIQTAAAGSGARLMKYRYS